MQVKDWQQQDTHTEKLNMFNMTSFSFLLHVSLHSEWLSQWTEGFVRSGEVMHTDGSAGVGGNDASWTVVTAVPEDWATVQ